MFHVWISFAGVGFWVILATAICTAAKMVAWSNWRASRRVCVCVCVCVSVR